MAIKNVSNKVIRVFEGDETKGVLTLEVNKLIHLYVLGLGDDEGFKLYSVEAIMELKAICESALESLTLPENTL